MPKILLLAAAALALSLAAVSAGAQSPLPTQPRDFAQTATESDHFEITEGQTAVAESQNPRVRAFAQEMIRDHTATSQTVQQAAARSGLPPPRTSLSGDQSKMLSALQSLRGPDFDKTYARQQVLAHYQALVVEQGYASSGSDPNLRQAATSAVPIIRHHLQMAQQMQAQLGGS
jgi:putative membrane protein